jgi:hypothetical protein
MQKLQLYAAALALAACASDSDEPSAEARRGKGGGSSSTMPDAAEPAPPPTSSTGVVTCYTEGAPLNACTLPVHCCFSNYSANHNGYCTTSACVWGTIVCDGPEDCASGQHCCGTRTDYGWTLACTSNQCGAPPLSEELCHDSGICSDRACTSAYGVAYDFPRTLSVCR